MPNAKQLREQLKREVKQYNILKAICDGEAEGNIEVAQKDIIFVRGRISALREAIATFEE